MGNNNSNALSSGNVAHSDANVIREGFMEKWGSFLTQYEKSWFVLYSNGMMVCTTNPGDSKQLSHYNLSVISKMERKSPTTFEVTTADTVWAFRCLNEGERDEWFDAIRSIGKTEYLNPRELADLCINQVIPGIMDRRQRYILAKYESLIRSVFMQNDIDSLSVQRIEEWAFGDFMRGQTENEEIWSPSRFLLLKLQEQVEYPIVDVEREQTGNEEIVSPSRSLLLKLQEKVEWLECHSLNWKHIGNAVAHEMTDKLSKIILSLSADLGDFQRGELTLYSTFGHYSTSGHKLVTAINTKTKRTLTDAETQYLRSLMKRATDNITLCPIADRS